MHSGAPNGPRGRFFHENVHFPAQNAISPRIQYGATFCALKRNVLTNLPGGRSPLPLKCAKSCTFREHDGISWKNAIFAVYYFFGTFTVSGPQNALNSFTMSTILAPLAPLGARWCVNHKKSIFPWIFMETLKTSCGKHKSQENMNFRATEVRQPMLLLTVSTTFKSIPSDINRPPVKSALWGLKTSNLPKFSGIPPVSWKSWPRLPNGPDPSLLNVTEFNASGTNFTPQTARLG